MTANRSKLKLPFHNISIRARLMMYFLVLVFVPLAIIMIIIYSKSVQIIAGKVDYSVKRSLEMAEENIMSDFNEARDFSTYIYLNNDFQNILSSLRPTEPDKVQEEMATIHSIINNYYFHSTVKTKFFPKVYMLDSEGYNAFHFTNFVFSSSLIEGEDWFRQLPGEAEYSIIGQGTANLSQGTIKTVRIARWLYDLKSRDPDKKAVLVVDISLDKFLNILERAKPSPSSAVFLLDRSGSVIAGTVAAGTEQGYNPDDIGSRVMQSAGMEDSFIYKNTSLVSFRHIAAAGFIVVSVSPLNEINAELYSLQQIIFIVLAVCVALVVLQSIFLSENISYPIRKLVQSMSAVRDGNLDIKLEYKRNDEFSYLFSTYMQMITEIRTLIEKVRLIEIERKEAELKALQSQINPHFLYNTLDSVNLLAMKYKIPEISTMVTSLSDFFRFSLNKGRDIITLMDEKRQVESYMTIQKIRFSDRIDFSVDFPSEILECVVVKLILQPIVENAIIHGIEKRRGKGMITIKAVQSGGKIVITVQDDGVGANVEEMNAILKGRTMTKRSFAIKNVDERIKRYFGSEYGLAFSSNSGCTENNGTTVTITIPAVRNWEERHG